MTYPNGLPAWIVNFRLKYLEPIAVPEKFEEYVFFVYQRTSVADPVESFSKLKLCPNQMKKLLTSHQRDLEEYKHVYQQWLNSRKVSDEFLKLELQMFEILKEFPDIPFEIYPFISKFNVVEKREHVSLPLPKFIANQFLFLNEPIRPPNSIEEYLCYYETSWDHERSRGTFDETPDKWDRAFYRKSSEEKLNLVKNFDTLKHNYDVVHDTWKRTLTVDQMQKFSEYCILRDQIKMLCQ
jgi:hypothetical protein